MGGREELCGGTGVVVNRVPSPSYVTSARKPCSSAMYVTTWTRPSGSATCRKERNSVQGKGSKDNVQCALLK